MRSLPPGLLRPQVLELLRAGVRWRVTYCRGAVGRPLPDEVGQGLDGLPAGVLEHVPTPAAARKIARGKGSRNWFHAELVADEVGPLLLLREP